MLFQLSQKLYTKLKVAAQVSNEYLFYQLTNFVQINEWLSVVLKQTLKPFKIVFLLS